MSDEFRRHFRVVWALIWVGLFVNLVLLVGAGFGIYFLARWLSS